MKLHSRVAAIVVTIVMLGTVVRASDEANLIPMTSANADQILPLALLGHGTPGTALWSPDGNILAIASSLGIWLFDGHDLTTPPRLLKSPSGIVATIVFSPDGTFIAGSVFGNYLVIWDVSTGQVQHQIMQPSLPNILTFSPNGKFLAGGYGYYQMGNYSDTYVQLWDAASMNLLATLETPTREVMGVSFSADSTLLAASALDESVRIWTVKHILDAKDKDLLLEDLILTGGAPIAFSNSGHIIAYSNSLTGEMGSAIKLWDVDTQKNVATFASATGFRFHTIYFEGDQLVIQCTSCPTANGNYILHREVWNLDSTTVKRSEAISTGYVLSFTRRASDGTIVSTHSDGTIHIWDEHFNPLNHFSFFSESVSDIAFTRDGTKLAGGSNSVVKEPGVSRLFVWDVQSALAHQVMPHPLPYDSSSEEIDISPDGNLLASVGGYFIPNISLWELNSKTQRTISVPGDSVSDVAFSPDGSLLASATPDGTVSLWNPKTGQLVITLRDQDRQGINRVKFSPDGQLLAASYTHEKTSTIEIWDIKSSLESHRGNLHRLFSWENSYGAEVPFAFSGNGQLATAGYGSLLIWDIENETKQLIEANQFSIRAIAFNIDGSLLATSDASNEIRFWDTHSGRQIKTLSEHTSWITALVFNSTNTLLASSSNDGTVRLWGIGK